MAWMTDVRRVERGFRAAADGDDAASSRKLEGERNAGGDLVAPGRPVGRRGSRVRRDDVPEQDALLEAELGQDAVHDGRARLGRAAARELALGGEREAGDPRAAVAGGLADEQERRVLPGLEVGAEALSPRGRRAAGAIEVERGPDRDARGPPD